jgi:hypothetical protein
MVLNRHILLITQNGVSTSPTTEGVFTTLALQHKVNLDEFLEEMVCYNDENIEANVFDWLEQDIEANVQETIPKHVIDTLTEHVKKHLFQCEECGCFHYKYNRIGDICRDCYELIEDDK